MKDENIKEILEALRDSIDDTGTDKVNFINWVDKIEDYITNLQEEKKQLKDGWQQEVYDKDKILNDWLDLKVRIDKAIELLKEAGCYDEETKTFCDDVWEELSQLLNILGGDDNE